MIPRVSFSRCSWLQPQGEASSMVHTWALCAVGVEVATGGRAGWAGGLDIAPEAPWPSSLHAGSCSAWHLRAQWGREGGPGLLWE